MVSWKRCWSCWSRPLYMDLFSIDLDSHLENLSMQFYAILWEFVCFASASQAGLIALRARHWFSNIIMTARKIWRKIILFSTKQLIVLGWFVDFSGSRNTYKKLKNAPTATVVKCDGGSWHVTRVFCLAETLNLIDSSCILLSQI